MEILPSLAVLSVKFRCTKSCIWPSTWLGYFAERRTPKDSEVIRVRKLSESSFRSVFPV